METTTILTSDHLSVITQLMPCPQCDGTLHYHICNARGHIIRVPCFTCNQRRDVIRINEIHRSKDPTDIPAIYSDVAYDLLQYSRFWKWVPAKGPVFDPHDKLSAAPRYTMVPDAVRALEALVHGPDLRMSVQSFSQVMEAQREQQQQDSFADSYTR